MYTYLVKPGVITLERLVQLMSTAPRERFGIPSDDDLCVWDLDAEYKIEPEEFKSMGRATPFAGWTVFGRPVMTIKNGKIVTLNI